MRVKKAVKQLSKAGALISAVASKYTDGGAQFQDLLKAAKSTLAQAQSALDGNSGQTKPAKQSPPAVAKKQSQSPTPKPASQSGGSKTDFIRSVVESHGKAGVTPKDVDEAFEKQGIPRSKNLIYNALGALLKQNKIGKRGNLYVAAASSGSKAAPAATKKRISPEGMKRIIEANQRRWAAAKKAPAKKVASR